MAGNPTRTPSEPDIPVEKIIEAAKVFETCNVRVTRQNSAKQWQTILNGEEGAMPVMELLNIDKHLDQLTGGGRYRVEPKNPAGVEPLYVVTPFYVGVEGNPRPKPGAGQIPGPSASMPGGMPVSFDYGGGWTGFPAQQAPVSGWAAGLPPQQQQAYAQMQGAPPGWQPPWRQAHGAPGASFASDQLAMRQVADMQAIVGKLEGKLEAEREKREQRERELESQRRADHERYERELQETRRREEETRRMAELQQRAEERAATQQQLQQMQLQFQQQLQQMTQQLQAPKSNPVADFGPLVTAYLAATKDNAAADRANQMQMMQMQMQAAQAQQQMMVTMLTKNEGADKPYLALLKEVMEQKGPGAQAALMQAMLDMQITTAGAMANLVRETMPEEPPVWLQAVTSGMSTIQNIATDMIEEGRQKRVPAQQQQYAQLPASTQHGLATVEVQDEFRLGKVPPLVTPASAPLQAQGLDETTQRKLASAAQKIDAMAMLLPEDFRTQEWRAILIELHAQMPVERVAHLLARHLSHLMEFRGLPGGFKDFVTRPKATLAEVLQFLPIASEAPEYARRVIETTVAYLTEEGYLGDDDEPEGQGEPAGRASGNGTAAGASGVVIDAPPDLGDTEILPAGRAEA